jgi:hypothetical protein
MAINNCSMEFLGMGHLYSQVDQLAQAKRYAAIEATANFIRRSLKTNPGIVENNRRYLEVLSRMNHKLYDGNISIAKEEWKALFRRVEESHISFYKQSEILQTIKLQRNSDYPDVMNNLFKTFEKDEFIMQLLNQLSKKNDRNTAALIKRIEKQMDKKASYVGRNWVKYKLHRQHLDHILKDPLCDKECKAGIRKLKSLLGVSSVDEHLLNPYFAGLYSPSLAQVRTLVYSVPAAYESKIIVKGIHDLIAAVRDIITMPTARRIIGSSIVGIFRKNNSIIKLTDKVFNEIESVTNHFPEINTLFTISDPVKKLDRLRNVNVMFSNDELLVTFARRVDTKAETEWDILLKAAKDDENAARFYARMVEAEKLAIIKGPLSPYHSRNPRASFVLIIFGGTTFGGYSAFTSTTEQISSSVEDISGDIIEQLESSGIDINSEEGKSFVNQRMDDFNSALQEVLKSSEPEETPDN